MFKIVECREELVSKIGKILIASSGFVVLAGVAKRSNFARHCVHFGAPLVDLLKRLEVTELAFSDTEVPFAEFTFSMTGNIVGRGG